MLAQVIGTAGVGASGFSAAAGSSAWSARAMGAAIRRELSVQVLAKTRPLSELAAGHGVSRKFLYQQAHMASAALDEAFAPPGDEQRVLYYLPVTASWLQQFVLGLALEGHASFRGIRQLGRDLLDYDVSVGTIHNILQAAVSRARAVNQAQDLSAIRVGAHDEIYQAGRPVLVGADVKSTYCYLLAEEEHCDETTWGVHLLDLERQGLRPDYTVADGGLALRAGQAAAWPKVPCHADVFHAERQLGEVAFYLERRAAGCAGAREKLEHQQARLKREGSGPLAVGAAGRGAAGGAGGRGVGARRSHPGRLAGEGHPGAGRPASGRTPGTVRLPDRGTGQARGALSASHRPGAAGADRPAR
jgi:hypothetical protein